METGVIILIVLIVLIILVIIGVIIYLVVEQKIQNQISPCTTNPSLKTLVDLSSVPPCQNNPNVYYLGQTNPQLNFTVSTFPKDPLDVCVSYCTSYSNGQCNGNQQDFQSCMNTLSPSTCLPPAPLATDGTNLYYALSVGNSQC